MFCVAFMLFSQGLTGLLHVVIHFRHMQTEGAASYCPHTPRRILIYTPRIFHADSLGIPAQPGGMSSTKAFQTLTPVQSLRQPAKPGMTPISRKTHTKWCNWTPGMPPITAPQGTANAEKHPQAPSSVCTASTRVPHSTSWKTVCRG